MSKKCVAYAIYHGRNIGVFTCWDKVQAYTNGFPDARFEGFGSYEEAFVSFKNKYKCIKAEIKAKNVKKAKFRRSSSNVAAGK